MESSRKYFFYFEIIALLGIIQLLLAILILEQGPIRFVIPAIIGGLTYILTCLVSVLRIDRSLHKRKGMRVRGQYANFGVTLSEINGYLIGHIELGLKFTLQVDVQGKEQRMAYNGNNKITFFPASVEEMLTHSNPIVREEGLKRQKVMKA